MIYNSAPVPTPLPSNRSVGLVFTSLFLLIAVFPLLFGDAVRIWALVVSSLFGLISLVAPHWLSLLTKYWMNFSYLLHKTISPIFLGALFFLVVTPVGCLMRLSGKDPLRLKLESRAQTYWQERNPPGPVPESLINQF
jgi:hypothetical protein